MFKHLALWIMCGACLLFSPYFKTHGLCDSTQPKLEFHKYLKHVKSLRGPNISSPKSVIFSLDGTKFFINSLEGMRTVVFDSDSFEELQIIQHSFSEEDSPLFQNGDRVFDYPYFTIPKNGKTNCFSGKPVESVLSHNGKYLWTTYYRRSWDTKGTSPSAVVIIDTATYLPVRIMPTGTVPKMLALSPDGSTMAVINWGDNTICLIDINSDNPGDFHYTRQLVDEKKLNLENICGNRDSNCGHCLRGAVFSPNSQYLLVGRMRTGNISVFDIHTGERIGILTGIPATPRHLVRYGSTMYVSSNASGYISRIDLPKVLDDLLASTTKIINANPETIFVGKGARTISLSPDGKYIYAVSNLDSRLSMIDLEQWKIIDQIAVSPYGVGLAVSPDGKKIVTTSQGRQGAGGHVIDIYQVNIPENSI
ncbi:hypothetical protein [Desulfovibrio sp. SGI.169]|uniref:YncE family protein n=1 Tax=Desulfovibrio sp. SGI.169 TaxID=3420561 RepID=UPI003CFDD77D